MRVFISYSRQDAEFALRIRDETRSLGYTTWLDVDDIPKGAYWPDAIDDGLQSADVVVGILSAESVASRNVKNEWDWAIANDRPLLLVMLHAATLPHRYISINYIDCTRDVERGLGQLREALKNPASAMYLEERQPIGRRMDGRGKLPDLRNRSRMLDKVKAFWIEGVLDNSLHGAALIELGMERRQDAVEQPWDIVLKQPDYPEWTLPRSAKLIDLFDKLNGKLLILGEPGAGKTTMLLDLARDLLMRAQRDYDQPIPVVFNLSSWADERKPLAEWLIDELNLRYQVPRSISKNWVEERQLLLLLDGLDEVRADARDACVEAINHFIQEQGLFVDVVVCSRSADYAMLTHKLRLQGALVLQPLTPEQIDAHLARGEEELDSVRQLLRADNALLELARAPLLLSIIVLVCHDANRRQLFSEGTQEERRKRLLDAYVAHTLERRPLDPQYGGRFVPYLSWLARQMNRHAQTIFFIEWIQADWLPSRADRWRYAALVGLLVGGVIGLLFGIGLATGVALGIGDEILGSILHGMAVGAAGGLIIGVIFGLAVAAVTYWRDIHQVESLSWSWQKAIGGALIGAVGGVIISVIGVSWAFRIAVPLALALSGALVGGMHGSAVEKRTATNQGVRRSLRNAIYMWAGISLIVGLSFESVYIGLYGFADGAIRAAVAALLFAFSLGVASALIFGGLAVVQHAALRYLLYRRGDMPLNYARFLDDAVGRVLLRKVGGGYIFVHRLLLDYFAALSTKTS